MCTRISGVILPEICVFLTLMIIEELGGVLKKQTIKQKKPHKTPNLQKCKVWWSLIIFLAIHLSQGFSVCKICKWSFLWGVSDFTTSAPVHVTLWLLVLDHHAASPCTIWGPGWSCALFCSLYLHSDFQELCDCPLYKRMNQGNQELRPRKWNPVSSQETEENRNKRWRIKSTWKILQQLVS